MSGVPKPESSAENANGDADFWPDGDAGSILEAREFVIPVVGAGIAVDAGLPSGEIMARHIASKVESRNGTYSDESNLRAVVDEAKIDPGALRELVAEFISGFDTQPTDLTRSLVHIQSRLIITFNYDLLLERTAFAENVPCKTLSNSEAGIESVISLLGASVAPDHLTVFHIHGDIDHPESIVLDPPSYKTLSNRGRFTQLVFALMTFKSMCFVGTALDELEFMASMRVQKGDRRHVLLCRDLEHKSLVENLGLAESRDGVVVATYPEHSALVGFAAKLVVEPRTTASPQEPLMTRDPQLPVGYIDNVLSSHGQRIDEGERLVALVLGTESSQRLYGEQDVALGQRTVIVGAPGSGKSELLRKAGELVPPSEFPVLINCARLDPQAGDGLKVLTSIASKGTGLRPDVVVNEQAIRAQRFHLFFDGLDEKSIEQQREIARFIVGLADAFPQHRFTVASRPIDALEEFPASADETDDQGWRILDLSPDRDWQARYLTAAGVSLSDLEEEMPALRDLTELLQLPFFLATTVDLHKQGQLKDFEDVWGLVQGLLTAALQRELDVSLGSSDARIWLRDVALSMYLAGRTSLKLDELAKVALPVEASKIVGSTEAVADALVARLLLLKQDGEYGFAHRMLGEALAAEALEAIEPTADILNSIAPSVDDAISGVRNDWVMPIAFLLSRDSKWRHAISQRDPLAAARSTPSTAPVEERKAAAETIWRTYFELKIWIWDYRVPDLLEDSEALGRLLQSEDLHGLHDEIQSSIDDSSPQVQGNAIRVLSRADPPNFERDLERVLKDDAREPVVRRQAAIAARDVNATGLLAPIVDRAVSTIDEPEAQDCSLCAMDMATDDQLVDTAIRLSGNRHSRIIAESRLRGRVSAPEMIRYLRAHAEVEPDQYGRENDLLHEAVEEVLGAQ